MGRHAGWIATHAGIAGGADAILVPERPFDIDERRRAPACAATRAAAASRSSSSPRARRRGRARCRCSRDTATDAFGHARLGGIGVLLEGELERRTGYESRVTILGHVQRGGTPVAYRPRARHPLRRRPRWTPRSAGASARWSACAAPTIVEIPLAEALREPKLLDPGLYETAELFFG